MTAQQAMLDTLANNLANADTIGYKQDLSTFRSLRDMALRRYERGDRGHGAPVGALSTGASFDSAAPDLAPGVLTRTGEPLDAAIVGDGLFCMQTPNGERYTRAGHFELTPAPAKAGAAPAAFLTDTQGNRLLGARGAIDVGAARTVTIEPSGAVVADGRTLDTLRVVKAPASALRHEGSNLLASSAAVTPALPTLRPGYVERSNVGVVGSMVRMITVQRAYEAAQRTVTAQDETLGKLVNEAGRF